MNLQAPWTAARWVAVDVEGNGQQPPDLVELAAAPIVDGVIGQPPTWLVKPHRPITTTARSLHRITDAEVVAPTVADEIAAELDGAVVIAHNAHVDLGAVLREIPGYRPVLGVANTLKLTRRIVAGLNSYRLGALASVYGLCDGIPVGRRPPRAAYDALVCGRLLVHLATMTTTPRTIGELLTITAEDPAPRVVTAMRFSSDHRRGLFMTAANSSRARGPPGGKSAATPTSSTALRWHK